MVLIIVPILNIFSAIFLLTSIYIFFIIFFETKID